jgi:hypothetical protein
MADSEYTAFVYVQVKPKAEVEVQSEPKADVEMGNRSE